MRKNTLRYLLLGYLLVLPFSLLAEDSGNGGNEKEESAKTIAELTDGADRFDGLFTLFRDPKTGETSMLVRKDQLGKEFIISATVLFSPIHRRQVGP